MTTIDKIDYKVTKEKIFDRPIYAQAIRELTPTKPDKKAEPEDPKEIHKELLKNNKDTKKDPKRKEKDKSNKPKLKQSTLETLARNRTQSLSKQESSLMNYLSPTSKAISMFAKSLEQHILPNDLEGFGSLNDR